MPLKFVDQTGIYNPNTEAIRFFALDGQASVLFTISREALEDLERAEELNETELVAAFEKHLPTVRQVAERVYRAQGPGSFGAYVLKSEFF